MVNRIYFKADSKLQDDFRLIAKEAYDTDLLETDFRRDANQLVNKINNFIASETKNKIQNVFKEIDTETVMLLINVVYFKAKWMKPFPLSNVRLKKFTNLNGERKRVDTMYDLDFYSYAQFEQYKILQLDYMSNCSMFIVLPNEEINLHDLLKNLDAKQLNQHLNELKLTQLDLQLPKFNLKSDLNLKKILEHLGLQSLFNNQANLSKISNETNLMVTDAVQSAFINVDEDGTGLNRFLCRFVLKLCKYNLLIELFYLLLQNTEAAAATIYKLMPRSMFVGEEFHANRPFIFIIRLNGINIFVGALKHF